MRTRRRLDDDDEDDTVRDGEVVRVHMLARDSRTAAIDYCSADPLAAHRPGFRRAANPAVRNAAERAYQQMCRDAETAWRSPERAKQDAEAACDQARIEVMCTDDMQRVQRIRDESYWSMVRAAEQAWRRRP